MTESCRTRRDSDRDLAAIVAGATASAIFALWLAWFASGALEVVERSTTARLEFGGAVVRVEAPVGAALESLAVLPGDRVTSGQLLAKLDSRPLRDEAAELTDELASKEEEAANLSLQEGAEREIESAEVALYETERAHLEQKLAGEEQGLQFAGEEAARVAKLAGLGLYPELDRLRNQAALRQKENAVAVLRRDLERQRADHLTKDRQARARSERLTQQQVALAGEIASIRRRIEGLEHEIRERELRAPVAGTVGRALADPQGAFIEQGESVVEIASQSQVEVEAFFPVSALGRLRPGQPARVRLDLGESAESRPWQGIVQRIETEPSERGLRVQLKLADSGGSENSLRHGTPARVEVVVDRLSPFRWATRRFARFLEGD